MFAGLLQKLFQPRVVKLDLEVFYFGRGFYLDRCRDFAIDFHDFYEIAVLVNELGRRGLNGLLWQLLFNRYGRQLLHLIEPAALFSRRCLRCEFVELR